MDSGQAAGLVILILGLWKLLELFGPLVLWCTDQVIRAVGGFKSECEVGRLERLTREDERAECASEARSLLSERGHKALAEYVYERMMESP